MSTTTTSVHKKVSFTTVWKDIAKAVFNIIHCDQRKFEGLWITKVVTYHLVPIMCQHSAAKTQISKSLYYNITLVIKYWIDLFALINVTSKQFVKYPIVNIMKFRNLFVLQ
jgi:hypothetical protein